MKSKTLLNNAASLGVVQLVSLGLPLLSLPYLARVLGPNGLGNMVFAMALAQMITVITDYGFNLSASKAVSLTRDHRIRIRQIWIVVTLIKLAFASIGLILIFLYISLSDLDGVVGKTIIAAYIAVIGSALLPQWLFQGLEKLVLFGFVQLVAKISAFVLIFIFINQETDIVLATFIQSFSPFLGAILSVPLIMAEFNVGLKNTFPSRRDFWQTLVDGWYCFISTASVNFYTAANPFVLGLIVTPTVLGFYSIAEKLIRAAQALYGPVSSAVYPHVARLAKVNPNAALEFNRRLLFLLLVVAVMASISIYVLSELIIINVFGEQYRDAVDVLKVFSLLPVVVVLSNVFGVQTMLTMGFERQFGMILLAAAFLNFVIFIPLSIIGKAEGAATANLLIEIFVAFAMGGYLHAKRINPLTYKFQEKLHEKS